MKLSKEQKEFAIKELDTCSRVELLSDRYEISLRIQRHKMKLVVGIFVNHTVKGCWCSESSEHPEAKYLAPYFVSKYKPTFKNKLLKIYGKRKAYREHPDLDDKYEYRLPYFSSATRAINHLIKVSESIELITEFAA